MGFREMVETDLDRIIFNTDEFAETVTRYPLGDTAAGAPVTAVFIEDDAQELLKAGKEHERMGSLQILEDQAADERDRWLINSEEWDAVTVGTKQLGMKTVRVRRITEEYRYPVRPR